MRSIQEILGTPEEQERLATEKYTDNLRVAMPGIIQEFNAENQTATVQPAIKEQINGKYIELPLLLDVPVQFPRAGGYCMTFPVKKGDECMVVFNDMCIDSWWQSGDVQTQLEKRRHDLSDATAILGITSVPRALENFSVNSMQLRAEDEETIVDIKDRTVSVKAANIALDGRVNIMGNLSINRLSAGTDISGAVTINNRGIKTIEKSDKLLGSLYDMMCAVEGNIYRVQKSKNPVTGRVRGYAFFAEIVYYDEDDTRQTLEFIFNGYYPSAMGVFGAAIKGGREELDVSLYDFMPADYGCGWLTAQENWTDFYIDIEYFCNLMDKIGIEITVKFERQFSQQGIMALAYCEIINDFARQKGYLVIENNNLIAIRPHNVGDGSVTIGFGHYIQGDDERKKYKEKYGIVTTMTDAQLSHIQIPIEECVRIYKEDYKYHVGKVNINLRDEETILTQNEFDALVIMRYNMGNLNNIHEIAVREPRALRKEFRSALLTKRRISDFPGLTKRTDWELNIFYDNNYNIPPDMTVSLTELKIEGLSTGEK